MRQKERKWINMIAPSTDPRQLDYEDNEEELRLLQTIQNNHQIVNAYGVIDETTVATLMSFINSLKIRAGHTLIINMSGVTFVDSEGFGALMSLQSRLMDSNGKLALVSCCDEVRLALKLTRLEVLFPMYNSIQEVP